MSVLVYGFGNVARGDDALGVLFAEQIERQRLRGVSVLTDYQLNAEDSLAVSEHDVVIFADASKNQIPDFRFSAIAPASEITFSTHAMLATSVLALSKELFGKAPSAYVVEMRGFSWDLGNPMSEAAKKNLTKALTFIEPLLLDPTENRLRSAARRVEKRGS
jgi:hydrogenase maturation protease